MSQQFPDAVKLQLLFLDALLPVIVYHDLEMLQGVRGSLLVDGEDIRLLSLAVAGEVAMASVSFQPFLRLLPGDALVVAGVFLQHSRLLDGDH